MREHSRTNHLLKNEMTTQDKKTWTIRRVSTDTIDLVKEAADVQGMKVGAWVDSQLREAAEVCLGGGNVVADELASVAIEVESKVKAINEQRLQALTENLDVVIRGQHSLFTLVTQIVEQNNKQSNAENSDKLSMS